MIIQLISRFRAAHKSNVVDTRGIERIVELTCKEFSFAMMYAKVTNKAQRYQLSETTRSDLMASQ